MQCQFKTGINFFINRPVTDKQTSTMELALTISIVINLLFFLLASYAIYRKGGLPFLRRKLGIKSKSTDPQDEVYYQTKNSIFEDMPAHTNEVVFLGDSLTNYCDWSELFGKPNLKNRGINGDTINGVINRLDEIIRSKPKKIFLMIGINDLEEKNSIQEILTNYERLLVILKQQLPATELIIQSLLPTHDTKDLKVAHILKINLGLIHLAKKYHLTYVSLFDLLKTRDNMLDVAFTLDGVHLNGEGYLVWKKAIETYIN